MVVPASSTATEWFPGLGQPGPGTETIGPLGTLTATVPGGQALTYVFTPEDAVWTARFLVGESGGKGDANDRAVLWTMLNRFGLFAHAESHWGRIHIARERRSGRRATLYRSFHRFLRSYSTPLQPYLRNPAAVERALAIAKRKPWNPFVQEGSFVYTGRVRKYQGKEIPKGQLAAFLRLQRLPWSKLPSWARKMTEDALVRGIENPVGLASEFANTRDYYRQRHPKGKLTEDLWRHYTEAMARGKGWVWIGPRRELDQINKNAFFIDRRVVTKGGVDVRVVPPPGGQHTEGGTAMYLSTQAQQRAMAGLGQAAPGTLRIEEERQQSIPVAERWRLYRGQRGRGWGDYLTRAEYDGYMQKLPFLAAQQPLTYRQAMRALDEYQKIEWFRPYYQRLTIAASEASLKLDRSGNLVLQVQRDSFLKLFPDAIAKEILGHVGGHLSTWILGTDILGPLGLLIDMAQLYRSIQNEKLVGAVGPAADEARRRKTLSLVMEAMAAGLARRTRANPAKVKIWLADNYQRFFAAWNRWEQFVELNRTLDPNQPRRLSQTIGPAPAGAPRRSRW